MRRIQYHRYGGPEELRLQEVPVPTPGRHEVLVRVKAAGANPADGKVRAGGLRLVSGSRFPRGYGHDFAGVVEAVGPGVTTRKAGDEVYGISGIRASSAFADYIVIAEKEAYPKPQVLCFELAAAVPMASVTAWSAVVDRAKISPGQTVFIAGCLGGLGRAGVQTALMRGATVVGSCSASDFEEALALGVSEAYDYRGFDAAAFRGRFDLVFDTAGALSLGDCAAMLKRGGVAVHAVPTPAKIVKTLFSPKHALASGMPTPSRMVSVLRRRMACLRLRSAAPFRSPTQSPPSQNSKSPVIPRASW